MIVTPMIAVSVQPEPSRSIRSATVVSHDVRSRATCSRNAVSARSANRSTAGNASAAGTQISSTTERKSQSLPLRPMLRGSGGGAPVGRRRRRVPSIGSEACDAGRTAARGDVDRRRVRHRSSSCSSHAAATRVGDSPIAICAFRSRSSSVVRRLDTRLTRSTSFGPNRLTTSRCTIGVTFSAGWSRRSSASATSPPLTMQRLGGEHERRRRPGPVRSPGG